MVVGGEGSGGAGLLGGLVVPDGCGEREYSLQYACGDAGAGAAAVALEAELGFEGPVDRFDDLAQTLVVAGPLRHIREPGLEVLRGVADQPRLRIEPQQR